jgi:sec-independent protein translocase protein TatB
MEKKWREENERIMREHPMIPAAPEPEPANPSPDELLPDDQAAPPPASADESAQRPAGELP